MYASLFDLYAVLDALLFQTVGADARILPMGQKTTPSPDQVLVARKLNMGKSFRGELGGPDALSKRVGVYVVTLSLPPDMPVPAGYALQGRIENAFRRTALPLAFRRGTPMRGNNATGARNGTGWALYPVRHRRSAHLLYDSEEQSMSENTCPNVALSRNQNMWVVKESADKTLEFPAVTDIINVTADVFAKQEIPTSDSKEKANTLNKLNVFNSSASPATANFGMYLRPTALDAPMQGDALMQALQGKLAAPFTGTLADALTDSDAQLAVTVASGHVLLRGVIEVASTPSGKELIRYRKAVKDAASPGKWPLSELIRGYKGTTAASGASGASVSLKSRAFVQALCRPNVSAWIVIDKTLQAVQGCHVTDASISATKEGAVELTGTLTGCRVFNAGPSSVAAEAQTSATSITVEDAKMFFVGQKIQNTTKSDDNSGKGYAVTAVDERTNTLTVAPGISGAWAVDDVVTWWMPYGPAIGNELENADSVIRIDGTAGKMRSYTIKFSTPTEFTDELGDRFPGQPIDTMRASSVDFEYYMRNDAAKRLREGSEGKEVRFDAEFGSEEGRKLVVSCPRIKNKMPAINADSATVTLSQSSDILGVTLEDAVEIILE